jgi:hypothetical protein
MTGGGGGSSYINTSLTVYQSVKIITQATGNIVANNSLLPALYNNKVGNGGHGVSSSSTFTNTTGFDGKSGLVIIVFT